MLMVYPWVRGSPDIISETITNQFRQIQLFTDKIGNNRVRLFTIPIKLNEDHMVSESSFTLMGKRRENSKNSCISMLKGRLACSGHIFFRPGFFRLHDFES